MLYPLLRTLLFQLDAERAHELALAGTRRLAANGTACKLLRTLTAFPRPVRVAGLMFPNPVGLAAGMDKNAVAPLAWWAFGFGFVELGTATPKPQAGNPKPRMFREPANRAVVNRMGFNNDGVEAVAARLAAQARAGLRPPFPVGISVGKNALTPLDQAADDYAAAAAALAPFADFVTINVSSPNTSGLRSLQTAAAVRNLVRAVAAVIGGKPLFVKVAPELTGGPLEDVAKTAIDEGCVGVIATNTLATHGLDHRPVGGLSGRPLQELSPRRVEEVRRILGPGPAVIGVGGIDDVASARRMLAAGADLLQIYTGLVYEGPFLAARVVRGLRRGGCPA